MSRPVGLAWPPDARRLQRLESAAAPYFLSVVAVAAGVALRSLLHPELQNALPFITLFPAVFVAAFVGGFGPAVLATLLSSIAAAYYFLPPVSSFAVESPVARLGLVTSSPSMISATRWSGTCIRSS